MLFDRKPTEDSNHICKLFAIYVFTIWTCPLCHRFVKLIPCSRCSRVT